MTRPHKSVYEALTADNDLVGMFAYIIYKRNKIEFCTSFHGDRPAPEVLEQFHAIASLDSSLDAYRAQGEAMARQFLNDGLSELAERTEREMRADVVVKRLDAVNQDLGSRIDTIDRSLHARRTFGGWIRDVGGNLLVNLVTIAVIGALVIGYQYSGRFQQGAAPAAATATAR